jgi:hypothetical protein
MMYCCKSRSGNVLFFVFVLALLGENSPDRTRRTGQEGFTVKTGQGEQDREKRDKENRTGKPEQGGQVRGGQLQGGQVQGAQGREDRTERRGQGGQDREDRTGSTGQGEDRTGKG